MARFTNIQEAANSVESRRPTFNVQCFVDVRVFAGLHVGMKLMKVTYSNKSSELVRVALELLHDVLVRQGKVTPIESTSEAIGILEADGFSLEQFQNRRRAARLERALVAESLAADFSVEGLAKQANAAELEDGVTLEWVEENIRRIARGEEPLPRPELPNQPDLSELPDYLKE